MSYGAIMTHVQADSETAPRLKCAIDTAKRFDAAIIGVAAEMVPPLAFDGGFYSLEADWMNAMRTSIEERQKQSHQIFRDATSDFGARALFRSGMQMPAPALAAASRAADLIVAGGAPHRHDDAYRCCGAAELAIGSGRPVLVAPPTAPALSAKQILLAWKDTREARRALSDAMPFLEEAEHVVVLAICPHVDEENARIEVDDVADALKRRGVQAESKVMVDAHADGWKIVDQAKLEGADLIVCGAYGHSRFGEWAFGGVTYDLLQQEEVYLLFSH